MEQNENTNSVFNAHTANELVREHTNDMYYTVYLDKDRTISRSTLYNFLNIVWSIQMELSAVGYGKRSPLASKFWIYDMHLDKKTYYCFEYMLEQSMCFDPAAPHHNRRLRFPPSTCIARVDAIFPIEKI